MRQIKLSKGKVALVDDEDFEKYGHINWHYSICSEHGYAKNRTLGYLHRLIMNAKPGQEVDHINRNTTDNRKSNLRICDRSKNTFNHAKRKTNTSGHTGVWLDKRHDTWVAEIMVNYRKNHIGRFKKLEDAIAARKEAEKKFFPDFERHA